MQVGFYLKIEKRFLLFFSKRVEHVEIPKHIEIILPWFSENIHDGRGA